jgi:HEAT repeat protein
MRRMADLSETNFDLEYRTIGFLLGLDDEDAQVRESAIGLLWADETPEYMARLIEMSQWDESALVRAAAVSALGSFILAGELGEITESMLYQAQDVSVSIYSNETEEVEVRRRALEAISNSSHEIVPEAIDEAYHSDDPLMRVSAVYAMGRTYDLRWKDIVLRELRSDDPEMRYEAARASGELELEEAVPYLIALTNEGDREILEAAVWSMGEIGGDRALTALAALAEAAEEAGDDSLLEAVEDAIGSATIANMGPDLDLDDE